jgi:hypothetical protein
MAMQVQNSPMVRIQPEQYQKLKKLARRERRAISRQLEIILAQHFDGEKDKQWPTQRKH